MAIHVYALAKLTKTIFGVTIDKTYSVHLGYYVYFISIVY